jgi:hypothetical protein
MYSIYCFLRKTALGIHLALFFMLLLQDLREKYALNYAYISNNEITENCNPLKAKNNYRSN